MLDQRLPEFKIKENVRPNWLISSDNTWLELDFYIEELNIAFEVQGEQHYKFVPFFHKSEDDFTKRKKHDKEKRDLCYGKGIKLIEILTETDAEIAIKNIRDKHCVQPVYFYGNGDDGVEHLTSKQRQEKYPTTDKQRKRSDRFLLGQWIKEKNNLIGNHKERRHAKLNDADVVEKRLQVCIDSLNKYEKGLITATDEKYNYWKKVVENKGLFTE